MVVLLRCCFFRADHHDHAAAFHGCIFFNTSLFADRLGNLCKHHLALFLKLQFPTAENDGNFYLVALFQELKYMSHFYPEIMLAGKRPQLDFLGLHRMVRFFLNFFALLVFVLTVIHHTAHWRVNIRRYLYEVIALFACQLDCLPGFENAQLFAFAVNDSDAGALDSAVDLLPVGLFFYVRILLTG